MKSIGQIIQNKSTIESGLKQKIFASQVVEIGSAVIKSFLNNELTDSAEVLYFKNGTLTIGCIHVTVAQELQLHNPQIIAELQKRLKTTLIKKIHFILV
jgi:hypothetical protein